MLITTLLTSLAVYSSQLLESGLESSFYSNFGVDSRVDLRSRALGVTIMASAIP